MSGVEGHLGIGLDVHIDEVSEPHFPRQNLLHETHPRNGGGGALDIIEQGAIGGSVHEVSDCRP